MDSVLTDFILKEIMSDNNSWRQQSLETLENHYWDDFKEAPSNLVKRCIELSTVPVDNFSFGDLRIMIGQKFGLQYLVPLAIEKLENNIFLDTGFYEGDLLECVLKVDTSFWNHNENIWTQLNRLVIDKRQEIKEMGIGSINFDNSNFAKNPRNH